MELFQEVQPLPRCSFGRQPMIKTSMEWILAFQENTDLEWIWGNRVTNVSIVGFTYKGSY